MGRRRAVTGVLAALVVGAIVVAGCSGDDSKFNTVGNAIETSDEASSAGSDGGAGGADASLVGRASVQQQAGEAEAPGDRQVAYTGSVTVRVDDPVDAAEEARAVADRAGGYLSRSGARLEGDQEVTLTLRIPAEAFEDVLAEVAELGEVLRRDVDSEDVTDQVVDLEGRLENARTSAERIRELLAKAEQVQNLITLEDRLTQRQTEIEALEGQLQVLGDRVALATIDVTLTEERDVEVSDDVPGPAKALRAGAVAVVNVGQVALAAAAFLLPFAPFLLLAGWLWRRAARRRRARRERLLPPPPPAASVGGRATPLGTDDPAP